MRPEDDYKYRLEQELMNRGMGAADMYLYRYPRLDQIREHLEPPCDEEVKDGEV